MSMQPAWPLCPDSCLTITTAMYYMNPPLFSPRFVGTRFESKVTSPWSLDRTLMAAKNTICKYLSSDHFSPRAFRLMPECRDELNFTMQKLCQSCFSSILNFCLGLETCKVQSHLLQPIWCCSRFSVCYFLHGAERLCTF